MQLSAIGTVRVAISIAFRTNLVTERGYFLARLTCASTSLRLIAATPVSAVGTKSFPSSSARYQGSALTTSASTVLACWAVPFACSLIGRCLSSFDQFECRAHAHRAGGFDLVNQGALRGGAVPLFRPLRDQVLRSRQADVRDAVDLVVVQVLFENGTGLLRIQPPTADVFHHLQQPAVAAIDLAAVLNHIEPKGVLGCLPERQ